MKNGNLLGALAICAIISLSGAAYAQGQEGPKTPTAKEARAALKQARKERRSARRRFNEVSDAGYSVRTQIEALQNWKRAADAVQDRKEDLRKAKHPDRQK